MLSDEQKREIERMAAEQLRRNWGVVKARPLAEAIDDIRARFVEEGWFGRPMSEIANHVQRAVAQHELYGRVERDDDRLSELGDDERMRGRGDVAELY
ncbi:MAG: hypothetical protein KDJ29_20735 [Hyphomicrobiales bacterium]|nr:hypothetical protein [Hyphomicrobiales bacterium]